MDGEYAGLAGEDVGLDGEDVGLDGGDVWLLGKVLGRQQRRSALLGRM